MRGDLITNRSLSFEPVTEVLIITPKLYATLSVRNLIEKESYMVKILLIMVALLIITPYCAHAFVGALKDLGKATGQAFNTSGEKVQQASRQSGTGSPRKQHKKRVIQSVGQKSTQAEEINKGIEGNKAQMEPNYQILNGQNDKIEGNKNFEILR